jgi:hypothetical protein
MMLSWRSANAKRLTREDLFSRLPERLSVEVLQGGFRGRYPSRLVSAECPFLTIEGLQAGEKPFSLPLRTKVRLGFALEEGWAEFEGEVVSWSAGPEISQMMVSCEAYGQALQRRHKSRFAGEIAVVCSSEVTAEHPGKIRNLSNSGMCVFFPSRLPEGRELSFRLLPEGAPSVDMQGEVIWKTSAGNATTACLAGVSARPISSLQGQRLRGLLSRLRREMETRHREGARD